MTEISVFEANKKAKKVKRGRTSQDEGKGFEKVVKGWLESVDVFFIKIEDGARVVLDRKTKKWVVLKVAGPLDFLVFYKGQCAFFEVTHTKEQKYERKNLIKKGDKRKLKSKQKQFNMMKDCLDRGKFKRSGLLIKFGEKVRFIKTQEIDAILQKRAYLSDKDGVGVENGKDILKIYGN